MERIICCTVIQFFNLLFQKTWERKNILIVVLDVGACNQNCLVIYKMYFVGWTFSFFLIALCRSCLPLEIILQWTYDWTITFHWYTWIERRVYLSALLLYEVCSANIMTRVTALAHKISPFAQLSLYLSGKRGERVI